MPKIHILEQTSANVYRAVAHFAMPTGNNSMGTSWQNCWLASFGAGAPATALTVGNTVGKISQSEANQVASGALIEIVFFFGDDPALDTAGRQSQMNLFADRAIDEFKTAFAERFKFYGYTQG